jgi:peptide-methionine (R)-S-oxide reductase
MKDPIMPQDLAADKTTFDLTPPTPEQFQRLVADLDDQEKHVLLEHGTEAPFCGVFLD